MKNDASQKWWLVWLLRFVAVRCGSVHFSRFPMSLKELEADYTVLELEWGELKGAHLALKRAHQDLLSEHADLRDDYAEMQTEWQNLKEEHEELLRLYRDLKVTTKYGPLSKKRRVTFQ